LYACETWYLKFREEHRLSVFENRVFRRIFRPDGDEMTGGWRKLYNEELHNLYSPPNIIRVIKSRRMGRVGHAARIGGNEKCIRKFWLESLEETDHSKT
jgi:hypothetical protein